MGFSCEFLPPLLSPFTGGSRGSWGPFAGGGPRASEEVWPQSWMRLTILDNKTDCSMVQQQEELGPNARGEGCGCTSSVTFLVIFLPEAFPVCSPPHALQMMVSGRGEPVKTEGDLFLFQKAHSPPNHTPKGNLAEARCRLLLLFLLMTSDGPSDKAGESAVPY